MDIPLLILGVVYLIILIGIVVVGGLNVHTALKFGLHSTATTVMSIVYIFGTVVIVLSTAILVSGADWSSSLTLSFPQTNIRNVLP